ncbi:TetR/AcrR family transcriptional regulator [Vagococcus intermedius]|uniref:TetR/AcrR family transcriptional regulator n=1 Tax=Vagococcus intermedius TaxID=2991418 RepID=A0AAF0CVW1_9ENTE|nr:TetR/AcrR family transcriptional regulator [Vagococcus intermedius]WEG73834.1 TetR/AcrR family transcriptional regulator [Vagococcus intermedius]WEG75919.1 TetR/AcrR family transcriptional regulator [Vagococcus intermedius]
MTKSELKKKLIVEAAKRVFVKKGYVSTTMQDIVDEARISRGGLYRYFTSVKELFEAVMRNEIAIQEENIYADLDVFLETQKQELLTIEHTLRVAGYEFMMKERNSPDEELGKALFKISLKQIEHCLAESNKQQALGIMLELEGLTVMALTGILEETFLTERLEIILERGWGNE